MVDATIASPLSQFAKLSCGGNDFIVVDCRAALPATDLPAAARSLCSRRFGVGADGLILLVPDEELPFGIKLLNADGSDAEVSYNGGRCVGLFAHQAGIAPARFSFASAAGPIGVKVNGTVVTLMVPPPGEARLGLELEEEGEGSEKVSGDAVVVGVPYLVIFRGDLDDPWVSRMPPRLRRHSAFPRGTNVAVARRRDEALYEARFFERGVEEETLSSGSGCVAVAVTAALRSGAPSPVTVATGGGDFAIGFRRQGEKIVDVSTSGEVRFVYRGELTEQMLELIPGV